MIPMVAVLPSSKKPASGSAQASNGLPPLGARVLAEFVSHDNTYISIVEVGGSLRSVRRRIARHGNFHAVQVNTIQQGFDLARKAIEGRCQLTSCVRSRSRNW